MTCLSVIWHLYGAAGQREVCLSLSFITGKRKALQFVGLKKKVKESKSVECTPIRIDFVIIALLLVYREMQLFINIEKSSNKMNTNLTCPKGHG